jgi:electron transport complex protein RnfD
MTEPTVISSPHRHLGMTVRGVMSRVAAALVPGILVYVWIFGPGVLVQCVLAVIAAVAAEALILRWRGRPLRPALGDGSVMVTGLLLALCLSPLSPWWATLIATVVAVALGKHAFGGLGQNLFNPAMVGFVFVLLCFPAQMNQWPAAPAAGMAAPGLTESLGIIFAPSAEAVDAVSGASALNHMKSRLGQMEMVSEIRTGPVYGNFGGRGWEWIALAWLAGGVALLVIGLIRWHIPAGFIAGMTCFSGVTWLLDADVYASPLFHLSTPGAMLGAFFIATDPVTAATSDRGRLVYGALIGILACLLRTWGIYPDGIAFAVLIGNACAPVIDRFTQPRVLGVTG